MLSTHHPPSALAVRHAGRRLDEPSSVSANPLSQRSGTTTTTAGRPLSPQRRGTLPTAATTTSTTIRRSGPLSPRATMQRHQPTQLLHVPPVATTAARPALTARPATAQASLLRPHETSASTLPVGAKRLGAAPVLTPHAADGGAASRRQAPSGAAGKGAAAPLLRRPSSPPRDAHPAVSPRRDPSASTKPPPPRRTAVDFVVGSLLRDGGWTWHIDDVTGRPYFYSAKLRTSTWDLARHVRTARAAEAALSGMDRLDYPTPSGTASPHFSAGGTDSPRRRHHQAAVVSLTPNTRGASPVLGRSGNSTPAVLWAPPSERDEGGSTDGGLDSAAAAQTLPPSSHAPQWRISRLAELSSPKGARRNQQQQQQQHVDASMTTARSLHHTTNLARTTTPPATVSRPLVARGPIHHQPHSRTPVLSPRGFAPEAKLPQQQQQPLPVTTTGSPDSLHRDGVSGADRSESNKGDVAHASNVVPNELSAAVSALP